MECLFSHCSLPLSNGHPSCIECRPPVAHRQPLRNPRPGHRRLRTQSRRHPALPHIALPSPPQLRFSPTCFVQHLGEQPLRLLFTRFLQLLPIMLFALLLSDQLQHLLPKSLCSPAPAPSQPLPIRAFLTPLQFHPLLHPLFTLSSPGRVVLSDAPFSQQPVHPQPRPPCARTFQVFRPTAPAIRRQS